MEQGKNIEKSTSERFAALWAGLSVNQRRYVVARQECASKKEAALAIGLEPNTIYNWPPSVEDAAVLFSTEVAAGALEILRASVAMAAMVKRAGMDSDNERIRQDAATEILDRVLGKALQRSDVTSGGETMKTMTWTAPAGGDDAA